MNKGNFVYSKDSINKLEECLRGEYSAVDTYDLAIKHVKNPEAVNTLRQIKDSHDRRAIQIKERLQGAGFEPPRTSGVWGGFARLVQTGADFFADRTAMAAFHEGEDRLTRMYTQNIDRIDSEARRFIETELRVEQERSFGLCRSLERFFKNP